ncbi:hypothetical protein JCM15519_28190 [Fundidesulfovibrio butyratiphilus]
MAPLARENHVKEDDIRPDRLRTAQQEFLDQDIAWLLSRKDSWVAVDCPACSDADHRHVFDKNGFSYRRCPRCQTVFVSPRPSHEVLRRFYETSRNYAFFNAHIFPASEQARFEKIFRPRAALVEQLCRDHAMARASLLEIGAGFGTFIRAVRERDFLGRIVAVQTGELAEKCLERGADAVIRDLMDDLDGHEPFDLVAAFEVIEHTFDPLAFLASARRALRPGGLVVLSCPNGAGFDILELGPESDSVDHEHLNYFTPDSLRLLLARAGLEFVSNATPGKLDVELVRKKWLARPDMAKDPFLTHLLLEAGEETRRAFQAFLAESGLSSHLVTVAKRPSTEPA